MLSPGEAVRVRRGGVDPAGAVLDPGRARRRQRGLAPVRGHGHGHIERRASVPTQKLCVLDPSELAAQERGDAGGDELLAIAPETGTSEGDAVLEGDARLQQVGPLAEYLDDLGHLGHPELPQHVIVLRPDDALRLALRYGAYPGHVMPPRFRADVASR